MCLARVNMECFLCVAGDAVNLCDDSAPDDGDGAEVMSCVLCGMIFSDHAMFAAHWSVHQSPTRYARPGRGKEVAPIHVAPVSLPLPSPNKSDAQVRSPSISPRRKQKSYECELCHRTFTRPDNLRTHMRIHTGEKPYQCEICSAAFTFRESLKYHQTKKHAARTVPK